MIDIRYDNIATRDLEEMVVLTGIPRSGTSILGQALGSLSSVEYGYEPPLITYLNSQCRHSELDAKAATKIALRYLYFDHFTEYLHGRRYSFRENDFSYILDMKPLPEILKKWSEIEGIQDAIEVANEHTFAFKSPGIYDLLDVLCEELPTIRVVDIARNLDRILASQYDKEWYFDHNLKQDKLMPHYDVDGIPVPYLVDEEDIEDWQSWNPETRSVYMVNQYAETRLEFKKKYGEKAMYLSEHYEQLIESPRSVIKEMAEFIGAEWGTKTEQIVASIQSTSLPAEVDDIMNKCEDSIQKELDELRPAFEYK